jgi:hypothetical protein
MLTNPGTLSDIRLTLTLVVVAALLFLAQLGSDDEPPLAGAQPIAAQYQPCLNRFQEWDGLCV